MCRRQKNAIKYPYPTPSASDQEMLTFNNLPGLTWFRAYVFDVWLLGLAAIETAETRSGSLGWIRADDDSTIHDILRYIMLP